MNCRTFREQIAAFLEQDHEPPRRHEFEAHAARCPACAAALAESRSVRDELESLGAVLRTRDETALLPAGGTVAGEPGTGTGRPVQDETLADAARAAPGADDRNEPAQLAEAVLGRLGRLKRDPARSSFMHGGGRIQTMWWVAGIAAAVGVFVLFPLMRGSHKGEMALATVLEHFHNAQSISFEARPEGAPADAPAFRMHAREDGRARVEMPDGSIVVINPAAGELLMLNTRERTWVKKPERENLFHFYEDLKSLQAKAVGEPARVQLDGREVLRYDADHDGNRIQVWADAQSGLPVRMSVPHQGGGGEIVMVFEKIVFDRPLDDSLFDLAPPAGYSPGGKGDAPRIVGSDRKMVAILMACQVYEQENGDWPDAITGLERYGVTEEVLRSPRCPDLAVGFVYAKPAKDAAGSQPVLFEKYIGFGEGARVGRRDTSVEMVRDEREYERLRAASEAAGRVQNP